MASFLLSAFADEAANSLSEQIRALHDNGIDYIEPRSIEGKGILTYTEDELSEISRTLRENKIKVGSLGSPIGKYSIDGDFDTHLCDFEKALRACEILGTDKMRMFSFYVEEQRLKECRSEVLYRLGVMCDMARERKITLCHENESGIYGQKPSEVKDLLLSLSTLAGVFDAANYRMCGADVIDGIEATFTRFAYMHVKDAVYESQTVLPAGEGEGRIAEVLDVIDERVDGKVLLTLEPHLHVFDAYSEIDSRTLRGKYEFTTKREAFDYAASALRRLLTENGYRRDENNEWKR